MKATSTTKKDFRNHRTGSLKQPAEELILKLLLLEQNETAGRTHCQRSAKSHQYRPEVRQLLRIFEAQQSESTSRPDDLPTSFAAVEMAIARCISECLVDVPRRKRGTALIQSLLADNGVVSFVPGKNPTVSLHRVHVILQDSFPGSYLCLFFNIMLAEFMNTQSKTIVF